MLNFSYNLIRFVLFFFFSWCFSYGQILPTQNNCFFPKYDSLALSELFPSGNFNTELIATDNSYKNEKDRIFRLMGNIDIYKSSKFQLAFYLANELNANSLNDIGFNPRQSIWEENLAFYYKSLDYTFNFSFFHRCKHEIDNSDSPNGDSAAIGYVPTKRVIILSGFNIGVSKNIEIIENLNLLTNINSEYYLMQSDFRTPNSDSQYLPNWNDLSATIRTNIRLNYSVSSLISAYSRMNLNFLYFGNNINTYNRNNTAIELGMSIKGKLYNFDAFFISENLSDELAYTQPNRTIYRGVGIRLRGKDFF